MRKEMSTSTLIVKNDEDLWSRPFEAYTKNIPSLPESNREWDESNASNLLRILTINMHGRPVDLAQGPLKRLSQTNAATSNLLCDDEYHLANAQERRMRGLFEWLDALPAHARPHVLCLQEVIWLPIVIIAERELARRGFVTLPHLSLAVDKGCGTCFPPRAGSGLGVYVQAAAGLEIVDGGQFVFNGRIGTDWLIDKGLKWAAVHCTNPKLCGAKKGTTTGVMLVATLHPQAYNELGAESPPGEGWATSALRKVATVDFRLRGGFPNAIAIAHRKQYAQAAKYLRETALPRVQRCAQERGASILGVFVGGDFNVNRYAATPGSPVESDPRKSLAAGLSREFRAALQTLGCRQPTIVREQHAHMAAPFGGRFTWDGISNSLAAQVVSTMAPAVGWIDSVLKCDLDNKSNKTDSSPPLYMDNRVVRMRLSQPCPELAPFWLSPCRRWRERALAQGSAGTRASPYAAANFDINERLRLGWNQLLRLAASFLITTSNAGEVNDQKVLELVCGAREDWAEFVIKAPYTASSQMWKGLDHYGLRSTDLYAASAAPIPIGAPHPFRMIHDVSDHYGVLARFQL
jgi:hypothetical protein